MERIEYREVTFDVVRTLHCNRSVVLDDAKNYLWHHWDETWTPLFGQKTTLP
jgi:hypothetical protein